MELFPEEMVSKSQLDLDKIAARLIYYQEQLKLRHWQTVSYAEHKALDSLYDFIVSFKDEVVEKLMGYTGKRPGVLKIQPLIQIDSMKLVCDMCDFAYAMKEYGESMKYQDICNLADSFSGEAAKTKYLLTLK